jgi:hypothetical protein
MHAPPADLLSDESTKYEYRQKGTEEWIRPKTQEKGDGRPLIGCHLEPEPVHAP